jgi:hypothetical protein
VHRRDLKETLGRLITLLMARRAAA